MFAEEKIAGLYCSKLLYEMILDAIDFGGVHGESVIAATSECFDSAAIRVKK